MRSLPVNVQGSTDLSRMITTKMMKAEFRGSRQVPGLRCQSRVAAIQSGVPEAEQKCRWGIYRAKETMSPASVAHVKRSQEVGRALLSGSDE